MKRTEDHLQAEIVKWWQETYPARRADLFHVPNEAKRTPQEAGRMAALGLMPGAPDLIVHVGFNHFVPIEVKAEGGRLSEAQKTWPRFGGSGALLSTWCAACRNFKKSYGHGCRGNTRKLSKGFA